MASNLLQFEAIWEQSGNRLETDQARYKPNYFHGQGCRRGNWRPILGQRPVSAPINRLKTLSLTLLSWFLQVDIWVQEPWRGYESTGCGYRIAEQSKARAFRHHRRLPGSKLSRTWLRQRVRDKPCVVWSTSARLSWRERWPKRLPQLDAKPFARHLGTSWELGRVKTWLQWNGTDESSLRLQRKHGFALFNTSGTSSR